MPEDDRWLNGDPDTIRKRLKWATSVMHHYGGLYKSMLAEKKQLEKCLCHKRKVIKAMQSRIAKRKRGQPMPLNVDDLSTEQLRAIAAAAMLYYDTRHRYFMNKTFGGELSRAKEVFHQTMHTITEAHDATKKD